MATQFDVEVLTDMRGFGLGTLGVVGEVPPRIRRRSENMKGRLISMVSAWAVEIEGAGPANAYMDWHMRKLFSFVELGKNPRRRSGAPGLQNGWYQDSKRIEKDVVPPVVVSLRARVRLPVHELVERARRVVRDVAVQLAQADGGLQRVPPGAAGDDAVGLEEGERATEDGRDRLYTHDEVIARE